MRRCASLYSETTPSVSVDRCGVCGEAWWRAPEGPPERAWLPPCHTPVGCGVPACEVDSTHDTTHANENRPRAFVPRTLFCYCLKVPRLSTLHTCDSARGFGYRRIYPFRIRRYVDAKPPS